MKTLAELEANRKILKNKPDDGYWLGKKRFVDGQISIMKEWHVEEMHELLEEALIVITTLSETNPTGLRIRKLLIEMEKEGK